MTSSEKLNQPFDLEVIEHKTQLGYVHEIEFTDPDIGSASAAPSYLRHDGSSFTTEPDVFYIDSIDIWDTQQGKGYGRLMFQYIVDEAEQRGFEWARLKVANPIILHITETLRSSGFIKDAVYLPGRNDVSIPEVPTKDAAVSPERLSYEEALAYVLTSQVKWTRITASRADGSAPILGCVLRLR